MKRSRPLLIGIAAAAGVLLGVAYHLGSAPPSAPAWSADGVVRLFASRFAGSDGKTQPIAQWHGKTLVVNFWATWCPPCREEMPIFSRLQAKYAAKGVQFVGIALDTADNVSRYSQQQSIGYPLLVGDAAAGELAQQLGDASVALPYTVVISAADKVKLARLGRVGEDELDALLATETTRR